MNDASKQTDDEVSDWINRDLSSYYDELLNEPMPNTIADLLKQLEQKEVKK